jgi:hypothetical protein
LNASDALRERRAWTLAGLDAAHAWSHRTRLLAGLDAADAGGHRAGLLTGLDAAHARSHRTRSLAGLNAAHAGSQDVALPRGTRLRHGLTRLDAAYSAWLGIDRLTLGTAEAIASARLTFQSSKADSLSLWVIKSACCPGVSAKQLPTVAVLKEPSLAGRPIPPSVIVEHQPPIVGRISDWVTRICAKCAAAAVGHPSSSVEIEPSLIGCPKPHATTVIHHPPLVVWKTDRKLKADSGLKSELRLKSSPIAVVVIHPCSIGRPEPEPAVMVNYAPIVEWKPEAAQVVSQRRLLAEAKNSASPRIRVEIRLGGATGLHIFIFNAARSHCGAGPLLRVLSKCLAAHCRIHPGLAGRSSLRTAECINCIITRRPLITFVAGGLLSRRLWLSLFRRVPSLPRTGLVLHRAGAALLTWQTLAAGTHLATRSRLSTRTCLAPGACLASGASLAAVRLAADRLAPRRVCKDAADHDAAD